MLFSLLSLTLVLILSDIIFYFLKIIFLPGKGRSKTCAKQCAFSLAPASMAAFSPSTECVILFTLRETNDLLVAKKLSSFFILAYYCFLFILGYIPFLSIFTYTKLNFLISTESHNSFLLFWDYLQLYDRNFPFKTSQNST